MLGICVIPVVVLCCITHVAVLWSTVLHAMLHTTQPLQSLYFTANRHIVVGAIAAPKVIVVALIAVLYSNTATSPTLY